MYKERLKDDQVCHKKKNCNMQVAHLYLKRQLWQTCSETSAVTLNKIWKPHQQVQALSTSNENMKGPPAGNKIYERPASRLGSVIDQ